MNSTSGLSANQASMSAAGVTASGAETFSEPGAKLRAKQSAIAKPASASASASAKLAQGAAVPLEVRGLSVSYRTKPAILSVDATFPAASMTAIVGPNGAGKSTLLKAALGIVTPLTGETRIFGAAKRGNLDRVAYVPQRAMVDWDFPTRVIDVVAMGLYRQLGMFGWMTAQHTRTARECLTRVGMQDLADRQIGQLSGGQQQRVFLARALAQNADLILLDEPLAGVDASTETAVIDVLKELQADGRTIVCVHHDLSTIADYFDRVLLINVRKVTEGSIASAFTDDALRMTFGNGLRATTATAA
ncbi:MAG: metal ABC transporter ATP-binding protein [Pseudomonadota bacterium]